MDSYSPAQHALRDYLVTDFLNGEHPLSTIAEEHADMRLCRAETRLADMRQFQRFLNGEHAPISNEEELQRAAADELSLYERIKTKARTDQDLRITAVVGGALLAAAILAFVVACVFPYAGMHLIPTLAELCFAFSEFILISGGVALLSAAGIGKFVQFIIETRESSIGNDAQNLQERFTALQQ